MRIHKTISSRILVLFPALLFAAAPALVSAAPMRKCPAAADGPLWLVDGAILGSPAELQRAQQARAADPNAPSGLVLADGSVLEQSDIFRIEIACMNPRDSTFTSDMLIGVGVVSIWTKRGPAARLEPTLAAIIRAQQAHFERHGSYATTLDDLDLPPVDAAIQIALEAQPNGWSVTSSIRRFSQQCFAFAGDIEPPYYGVPVGQPYCTTVVRNSYSP